MKVRIKMTKRELNNMTKKLHENGINITESDLKHILTDNTKFLNYIINEARKTSTKNIEVKHPGILSIPKGKHFWNVGLKHYINLARKKGKGAVMRALLNLARWNKNKNPKIAARAQKIINALKRSRVWNNMK